MITMTNRRFTGALAGIALLAVALAAHAAPPHARGAGNLQAQVHDLDARIATARSRNAALQASVAQLEQQNAAKQKQLQQRDGEIAALQQQLAAAGVPASAVSGGR